VLGQLDGNHRLDVQRVAETVVLAAEPKVEVALERDADQRGDRILQLLGELGVARLGLGFRTASRRG
jgi:hypothetical protein